MVTQLQKRVEWLAKEIAFGAVDLIGGMVGLVEAIFLQSYMLGTVILLGVAWVILRQFVLWVCPILVSMSGYVVFYLNVILLFLDIFVDAIIAIVRAIISVVDFLGHKHIDSNIGSWVQYKAITAAQLRQVLTNIPATCRKYDNAGIIIQFLVRYNVYEYTCPVVRFLFPIRWLFDATQAILSWTYYGGAEPFTDTASENCEGTGGENADYVCAALGGGFVVLEVLLPILIFYIAWTELGPGIKKMAWALVVWVAYLVEYSVSFLLFIIKAIES